MTVINTEIAETVEITSNGMHDVAKYTSANVAVPKVINSLNVTPTTSAQQITATSGVDGYSPVNVSAVTSSIDANITPGNIKSGVSILGVNGSVVELNGSTETVTPTTSQQTITPTSPSNGLTSVTVNAVTSSIDANITAGNIKDGVTILGVTGNYQGGGGGGGKTLSYMVDGNGYLVPLNSTMFDFTGVKYIDRPYMFQNAYYNSNIRTVSFGDVLSIEGEQCCVGMFYGSDFLTHVDMSNVRYILYSGCCTEMFANASSLSSIDLSMFQEGSGCSLSWFIMGTSITVLNMPSFRAHMSASDSFAMMLADTDGVTLHLPNDTQSLVESYDGYPDFGGDNATVLFDLPSTAIRTGADSMDYYRYPKYDTATALAWCPLASGSTAPYYTSGLTDPQVGDNIYSDAACTTVETTVASIETLE